MKKEEILRELHNIFKEISIIPPKPFEKFYEEHKEDDERYLMKMLRIGRQVISVVKK